MLLLLHLIGNAGTRQRPTTLHTQTNSSGSGKQPANDDLQAGQAGVKRLDVISKTTVQT